MEGLPGYALIMSRRIAILGASGSVGSTLAVHILRSRVLEPADKLLLVGHGVLKTERKLLSTRIDLMDAFDDDRVQIEMVPDVCDVEADIVIVAAGASLSTGCSTRRDLGETNRIIFEHIADQCASRTPEALFIVVSNPVELAVEILSCAANRKHVIGMGAQQDSLRFARAIATDLAISRHDVRATVMGEHGEAMVPLWRSVELLVDDPQATEEVAKLCARCTEPSLKDRVTTLRREVGQLLSEERVAEAYELTRRALPDARIFVEPFITAHSMHSTANATANATLQCIAAALANDRRRVHGQVYLKGEVPGLPGVCGVCGIPLTLGTNGWHAEPLDWLEPDELNAVMDSVQSTNRFVSGILMEAVRRAVPPENLLVM
jgi:malate dehydrogenase